MSPTPVTYTLADAARLVQLGGDRRGGRGPLRRADSTTIVRFDLNTSPAPPDLAAAPPGRRAVRVAAVRVPAVRLPPPRRGRRRRRTASAPDEILVGAGADEILDLVGKAFLPAGGAAVIPTPTYAMYRVITEQRGATRRSRVPRLPGRRAGRSTSTAVRAAAARQPTSSGCAARTTRPASPSPTARSRASSTASPPTPRPPAERPAIVVLDEAYAEFVGTSLAPAPPRAPEPRRRPDGEQGLRAGRAPGRLRDRATGDDRPDRAVPAAGLGLDDRASRS